jgi:hypothetical protein
MKQRVTRRARRFPVRVEVKEINGQPVADTFLVDLSALGARLDSSQPLAPHYRVECLFSLPGVETSMRVAGAIVWTKPSPDSPGRFHMGLKFFGNYWEIDNLGRTGRL